MFSAYKRVRFDHSILYSVVILFHYSINKKITCLEIFYYVLRGKKVKWSLKHFGCYQGQSQDLELSGGSNL